VVTDAQLEGSTIPEAVALETAAGGVKNAVHSTHLFGLEIWPIKTEGFFLPALLSSEI
jgi:hypothetical protein